MKQYTVYILLCADNSFYVGVTNNINRRLFEHQNGETPKSYTYKRRPVKLVFKEQFKYVNNAIAFEKQLKGWRREKKIALINSDWDKLPELSRAYHEKK